MDETAYDGGSAFALTHEEWNNDRNEYEIVTHGGLTKRDWFAAAAPAAEIDNMVPTTVAEAAAYIGVPVEEYKYTTHYPLVAAKARYAYADAMLAERSKP